MTITMNVAEAKAKLSELLDATSKGEHVVIARAGTPVVELVAVEPPAERKLGFVEIDVDDGMLTRTQDPSPRSRACSGGCRRPRPG